MQQTKEALAFFFSLGSAVDQAKKNDGKINYDDAGLLVGPAMKLTSALAGIGEVPSEFAALSAQERLDLQAWAVKEFDIESDRVEEQIEAGIAILIQLGVFLPKKKSDSQPQEV